MYFLPQEIEAWYIIPALRREISLCLVKDFKISYEKIGNLLGISKAAVSQYLKGKRAAKIKLPKELIPYLTKSCKILAKEREGAAQEITKLLTIIRDKKLTSEICGSLKDGVLEDCREIRYINGNYSQNSKV